jgi:hypothetical protein
MLKQHSPTFKTTNQSYAHITVARRLLRYVSNVIFILSILCFVFFHYTSWSSIEFEKSLNTTYTTSLLPKQNLHDLPTFPQQYVSNGATKKYTVSTVTTTGLSHNHGQEQNVSLYTKRKLSLRFDWTSLTPILDLTRRFQQLQSNCSLPMASITKRRFGLGSDLHMYGRALCNALETSTHRVRTVQNWTWMDNSQCQNNVLGSPMRCYFAQSELNCPGDVAWAMENPHFDPNNSISKQNGVIHWNCSSLIGPSDRMNEALVQLATMEFLFTRVTPLVYGEATRQLNLVFGQEVPKDLITVHIRWGDKVTTYTGKQTIRPEMQKAEIDEYIDAVNSILLRRHGGKKHLEKNFTANIFLATEDPAAVEAFRAAMPIEWNLYVDYSLTETLAHRVDGYNGHSVMTRKLNGRPGLLALASLLVAMEANDFVLTTQSNWSRLMDELRLAIVNPRCGNCTTLIDLRKY